MNNNNTNIIRGVLFLIVSLLASCGDSGLAGLGGSSIAPRFAYVANSVDSTISIYTVNATTGQLRHNGYVFTGGKPYSVTIDPLNKFAYVANSFTNDVSVYSINASNGALTQVLCGGILLPVCNGDNFKSGSGPMSVTIDPMGRFAYVANQAAHTVSAYTINSTTGALTSAGADIAAGTSPTSVTVDPTGKFAYVANLSSGDVSAYTINASTGSLTQIPCGIGPACSNNNFIAGFGSYSVTVDPSGRFAYVANANGSSVSAYIINAVTGALSEVLGSPFTTASGPRSVTVDPSGTFAYVANGSGVSAYSINASTGALFPVGLAVAAGSLPNSVTVDPSGKFVYVANQVSNDISVYTINAMTGAVTAAGSVRAREGSSAVAMTQGTAAVTYTPKFAYVANQNGDNISAYTINATSGALTAVASSPFTTTKLGGQSYAVTVTPSGKFAYVANTGSDISAFSINATTGAMTLLGATYAAGTSPISVSVDPSGKFAYVANNNSSNVSAYTINATTGAMTSVGAAVTAGTNPYSVTTDPSGRFAFSANFGSSDVSAYSINATTGVLTQIACTGVGVCNGSNFKAGAGPISVTVDPTGKFVYVANNGNSVSAYSIDSVTGFLTALSGSPFVAAGNPHFITVDPTGKYAYVTPQSSINVLVFTINATTGVLTGAGTGTTGAMPQSVTVDPSGKFAYVTNASDDTVSAYTIDASTGALTGVGTNIPSGANPQGVTTTGTIQ